MAPNWVVDVVSCFEKCKSQIDTGTAPHKTSDEVLEILRPELEQIGFKVETGKRQSEKLHRPVLFGELGIPRVKYEIDAYQSSNGIVLEMVDGRCYECSDRDASCVSVRVKRQDHDKPCIQRWVRNPRCYLVEQSTATSVRRTINSWILRTRDEYTSRQPARIDAKRFQKGTPLVAIGGNHWNDQDG